MPLPRRVEVSVRRIINHGSNVYTLEFEIPSTYTRFRPGQFTHLTVEPYRFSEGYWPESRVFSIASPPNVDFIRVVYSVKDQGYTSKIRDVLRLGSKCWLKLPYGEFVIDSKSTPGDFIVLIAGGTGISPFIPFLLDKSNKQFERNILLFYGIRNPALMIFDRELELALANFPNLKIELFSEEQTTDKRFRIGRLSFKEIWGMIEQHGEIPEVFLSGPPGMIDSFGKKLINVGLPETCIRIDQWE